MFAASGYVSIIASALAAKIYNLDMLKTPEARIISTVMNGIGVMPAFEGTLTTEEIEAVAYFVFNSTNN